MAKRILICSSQSVKKMNSGTKLNMTSLEDDGNVVLSSDSTEN